MKKITLIAALLFCAVTTMAAGKAEELGFATDKEALMAQAASENRQVLAFFTTDWCSWCRRLEQDVFATKAFQDGSTDWLKLVVDAEKGTGVDWARRFHVSGFPTLILLHPDGSEIERMSGYMPMPQFLDTFRDYSRGINTLDALQEDLVERPHDLALKLHVARKLEERGRLEETRAHLLEILEEDPANRSGVTDDADAAIAMAAFRATRDTAPLEEVLRRWTQLESGPQIYNILIGLAAKDGQDARMRNLLDKAIQDYPDNVELLNSYAWTFAEREWDLDRALDVVDKAVSLSEGMSANVLDTRAEILFRMGRSQEALQEIERALRLNPEDEYLLGQRLRFSNK